LIDALTDRFEDEPKVPPAEWEKHVENLLRLSVINQWIKQNEPSVKYAKEFVKKLTQTLWGVYYQDGKVHHYTDGTNPDNFMYTSTYELQGLVYTGVGPQVATLIKEIYPPVLEEEVFYNGDGQKFPGGSQYCAAYEGIYTPTPTAEQSFPDPAAAGTDNFGEFFAASPNVPEEFFKTSHPKPLIIGSAEYREQMFKEIPAWDTKLWESKQKFDEKPMFLKKGNQLVCAILFEQADKKWTGGEGLKSWLGVDTENQKEPWHVLVKNFEKHWTSAQGTFIKLEAAKEERGQILADLTTLLGKTAFSKIKAAKDYEGPTDPPPDAPEQKFDDPDPNPCPTE
jgi:hypothetical protein